MGNGKRITLPLEHIAEFGGNIIDLPQGLYERQFATKGRAAAQW